METRVNLYQAINRNRRDSLLLMFGMTLFFAIVGFVLGGALGSPQSGLFFGGLIAIVQGLIGWFAGDKIVLSMAGAQEITHADYPQLFNVVDEMRIAANIPMPRIYVIQDSAPNAFATGRNPEHAVIAVTTGLIDKLKRDELQGVIGHEVAHIRNGDVKFGAFMSILVGAIVLLCDGFWRWIRWGPRGRSRSRGGDSATAIFFVLAVILSILAPVLAKLIQMAWSRQREYLADASSAELTRNPLALASALRKIATDQEVLEASNRATQHLYIVNPVKPFEERAKFVFSTHPPIEQRIALLESIAGFYKRDPSQGQ